MKRRAINDIDKGKIGMIKAIKVNLNYVVINDRFNLYVFSLQALRNPLPSDAFVSKMEYCLENRCEEYDDDGFVVDETQIVCLDSKFGQIFVYDFGSFDPTLTSKLAAP